MSNLTLVAGQWHDSINQVEKTEPILGGSSGNANLATKQLAENILWLREHMQAHKVGDIYTTTLAHANAAAVAAHHGYGVWERYAEGRTLVGFSTKSSDPDDYKTMGNEFGENEETLTLSQIPSHEHTVDMHSGSIDGSTRAGTQNTSSSAANIKTNAVGGGEAHNNIQPSRVVGHWLRTA